MAKVLLNTELLKAFVAVAEQRSFTRAAIALHRTQSAVSMQVKRMEGTLGVELFCRYPQHIELSYAGGTLLTYARRMLTLNDEAVAQVCTSSKDRALRIGVMEDYGSLVLQPILARLSVDASPLPIEVVTGLTSLMLGRLGLEFDLVIAMHPQGTGGGVLLRREQAVWAVGVGCQMGGPEPLALALYRPGCLLRTWATEALDAEGRPWRLGFVGESARSVQTTAADSKMLTVVKSSMFPRQLRRVAASQALPRLPAADVRLHRSTLLSRSTSLFVDRLVEQLQVPQR